MNDTTVKVTHEFQQDAETAKVFHREQFALYSTMEVLRQTSFTVFAGFRESLFTKVCVYNLLQNFSASKLSWYMVYHVVVGNFKRGKFTNQIQK